MFPQFPSWDAIHPLIVHFPIVLTLIAPAFVLLAVILRKYNRVFAACALALMIGGTVGAILAVSSGEAGAELAEQVPGAEPVLEEHEELAETARTLLVVVTVVYALIVFAPLIFKKLLNPAPWIALNLGFLVLYFFPAVSLINASHQGAVLVHKYGAHANISADAPTLHASEEGEGHEEEDE